MKYSCPCPLCGEPKFFTEPIRARNRKAKCVTCRSKYGNRDSCKLFLRTCATCGKGSATQREKLAANCINCSRKEMGGILVKFRTLESYGGATSYTYFCPTCPSIRKLKARRKSPYCNDCSRSHCKHAKTADKIYFDFKEMKMKKIKTRYFRICPHCPEDNNTKEVQRAALGGIKCCMKHKYVDNPEAFAAKEAKRKETRAANKAKHKTVYKKKPAKKYVSQKAIDKQIKINREHKAKIKYQVIDEKTMEAPVKKRDPKVLPQLEEADSMRMQEEFLRRQREKEIT